MPERGGPLEATNRRRGPHSNGAGNTAWRPRLQHSENPGREPTAHPRAPLVLIVDVGGGLGGARLTGMHSLRTLCVSTVREALERCHELRPTVIVLALVRAHPDECDVVRVLSERAPALLLVTAPASERRITDLVKAGASGHLDFTEVPTRLWSAVQELLHGGISMSPTAARVVLRRARRGSGQVAAVHVDAAPSPCILSQRQREVLVLLARGHSYDHIALALDVSVNTIRTHLRVIYERLGASTKVEAVVIAKELGWIPA